jgi:hypothetical protein
VQAKKDPYVYTKKPRLKTGEELLRVTLDLQTRLKEVRSHNELLFLTSFQRDLAT